MPKSSPESVIEPRASGRCSCNRCHAHDTGVRGPYSPRDFIRLFGVANEPAPVEVPVELATLGIAVDVARARYDAARDEWAAALGGVARSKSAQSRHTGSPSAAEREAVEAAQSEADTARQELQDAGESLERAQLAYNSLASRLSQQARIEAYAADQASQEERREAAREQARATSQRRGLRALKARGSGAS